MGAHSAPLPAALDLWAPVPFDDLPQDLVYALRREDWSAVKEGLRDVMDGVTTDGVFGRELLQFVRKLPIGLDPVFDRYRAAASIDHGDWDGLRRCLAAHPVEPVELVGLRDIILAPTDRMTPPSAAEPHQAALFGAYEFMLERAIGRYRRWARQMLTFHPTEVVWSREDMPTRRHFSYRALQDSVLLASGEAQGGRLAVAAALAREAQRLGDEGEPLRLTAHDLEGLVGAAMGETRQVDLCLLERLAQPTGFSPLAALEMLYHVMPLLALQDDGSFAWSARLLERIAIGLASPRARLYAESWRVASELLASPGDHAHSELPGLLIQARHAGPGLRALPQLLDGYATGRHAAFAEAERLGRRAGNVWVQVSALAWMAALDPGAAACRRLHRLLEVTGWRRLVLVPPEAVADAALGLMAAGFRGQAIVELAAIANRPNVTVEVARRHVDDAAAPLDARLAAVGALGKLRTAHAQEILQRLSRKSDDLGQLASALLSRRPYGLALSEREVEVVDFARRGLTNREIAQRLVLSQHTVARHLANARAKLGASNRAEAAARLGELYPA